MPRAGVSSEPAVDREAPAGARPRPRNLVLLSDGTGNSAAKLHKTNVWWLYQALDLGEDACLLMQLHAVDSRIRMVAGAS
jgi:uncharacterized protein (DUF2235 family)